MHSLVVLLVLVIRVEICLQMPFTMVIMLGTLPPMEVASGNVMRDIFLTEILVCSVKIKICLQMLITLPMKHLPLPAPGNVTLGITPMEIRAHPAMRDSIRWRCPQAVASAMLVCIYVKVFAPYVVLERI